MMATKLSPETFRLGKLASLVGTSLTLFATAIVYAGTDDMQIQSPLGWQLGLFVSLACLVLPWVFFFIQKEPDQQITAGLISLVILLSIFWLFGYSGYYFYFGFAPMPGWIRWFGLMGGACLMVHWGCKIARDLLGVMHQRELFSRAYVDAGSVYHYRFRAFSAELEKHLPKRDPFKSYHLWLAFALTPFTLVLNRVLTPYTGSGHGVFIVSAILGLPMSLWIVGMAVRAYILMIHYPIKLQRQTGKPVLMRDFD